MANKLTITISGRKQAGKNTASNFIVKKFLERKHGVFLSRGYTIDRNGYLVSYSTSCQRTYYPNQMHEFEREGVKIYSFADPLKRFCIDVLGAPEESCYGTDVQKNEPIPHLLWENFPLEVRPYTDIKIEEKYVEFSGVTFGSTYREHKSGPMTGRELMQVIGTDICRRIYGDCWARGTYNTITREGFELALICDGRFPNEINMGIERGAKVVRLARNVFNDQHRSEKALDDYPTNKYSLYVDNQNMTIEEQCSVVGLEVDKWFDEAGI